MTAGDDYIADSFPADAIGNPSHRPFIERIERKIKAAKTVSDVLVVLPHVCGQYNPEPGVYRKWTVRWMAAAGADVIVCNHSHTPLQTETLADVTFVAYALGKSFDDTRLWMPSQREPGEYSILLNLIYDTRTKTVARKTFSVAKSALRADGVAVVVPAAGGDPEAAIAADRFAGNKVACDDDGEYAL